MRRTWIQGLFLLAATVALLSGLVAAIRVVRESRRVAAPVAERRAMLAELRRMEAYLDRGTEAQKVIAALTNATPVSLSALVQECLPDVKIEDNRETRREVPGGWVIRGREMTFSEVEFAAVESLVRKAEAQRPPWRLVQCTLRAGEGKAGSGQAILAFETVEKSR